MILVQKEQAIADYILEKTPVKVAHSSISDF